MKYVSEEIAVGKDVPSNPPRAAILVKSTQILLGIPDQISKSSRLVSPIFLDHNGILAFVKVWDLSQVIAGVVDARSNLKRLLV